MSDLDARELDRDSDGRGLDERGFDDVDFFRARPLYQNPYPYYEYLREHGPVWREPHRGVVMVTGYEEVEEEPGPTRR